ncbi:diaminopropionate ammonia-lyase [Desulforamulus aeronauticus]|uniref:Diaminopropionate ammonia-lyase n=1 Tax=Desulforamulus aeronauticus DSM 10349 TaxID=1121421 RepID=A0A1M6P0A9_9FIRM|nr:diaminopropionate ammonia-lyase [Desulforamulus aeronauticus]SHK01350.1 diaminopropionate ammonia-lyase [Desulforamulus aeronauticus DSM 10349]
MDKIQWEANRMMGKQQVSTDFLSEKEIQKAKLFHQSFPEYSITPLRSLHNLAKFLGVAGIYVKDESYRFGLNAFKVLGGSFAMGKYLAQKLGKDIGSLDYHTLTSDETRRNLGEITFATTTDGNHGRGVAWTANRLKQKSVVYMPKGSSQTRLENIRAEGAEAAIVEMNYDDAVRMTAENAQKYGWVIVQDTAWEGYEEIPTWIMQGYGTMAAEALDQLRQFQVEKPTHIFVQAGVGSLAGAVQGYFAAVFGEGRPKTIIVEADKADCLYKSALANDGKPRVVGGDMETIMAGLACGEPNTIGWRVLRDYSDMFFSCPDWLAAKGMRVLGNPLGEDLRVISGESGAVTSGLLFELMKCKDMEEAKAQLGLTKDSQILLFSTEGDTDPDHYRSIVWDGKNPSYK